MEPIRTRLRAAMQGMRAAWPQFARQLVQDPTAADLTMRQIAALMLLDGDVAVPIERLESTLGEREARHVLSQLAACELVEEWPEGWRLTKEGSDLLGRFVEQRADIVAHLVGQLPRHDQEVVARAWDVLAHAFRPAEPVGA